MRSKIYFKSRRYPTDTQFRVKTIQPSGVVNFMKIMSVVMIFSVCFLSRTAQAQNGTRSVAAQDSTQEINGTVYDNEENPLPGVTVRSKNGTAIVATQANGKFSIRVPLRSVLTFQYIGYLEQEV